MVEIISRQSVAIGCAISCLIIFQSPVSAQLRPANGHGATPTDQSRQIVPIDQVSLWDDAKIGRARAALSSSRSHESVL